MNYQLLFMATFLLTTVIAGCGKSRPGADPVPAADSARQKGNAIVDPEFSTSDKRIVAFVSWVNRKGVTLESIKNAEGYVAWRVAQAKTSDEYDVIFHIRSFPSSASALTADPRSDLGQTALVVVDATRRVDLAIELAAHFGLGDDASLLHLLGSERQVAEILVQFGRRY